MTEQLTIEASEILKQNLLAIKKRMADACQRSNRIPEDVHLIVVSKYRPMNQVEVMYNLGERSFGESRVQEGQTRIPDFEPDACFHLIGQLQTNKSKYLPGLFRWVHSVDRLKAINSLESAFDGHDDPLNILIQVNVAGEDQKGGCNPEDALELVKSASECKNLKLQGLMTMAPYADDPEEARPHFAALAKLQREIIEKTGIPLPHLSMGMSGDFEVAIEEGATMIRVGSSLFELPENV